MDILFPDLRSEEKDVASGQIQSDSLLLSNPFPKDED